MIKVLQAGFVWVCKRLNNFDFCIIKNSGLTNKKNGLEIGLTVDLRPAKNGTKGEYCLEFDIPYIKVCNVTPAKKMGLKSCHWTHKKSGKGLNFDFPKSVQTLCRKQMILIK